MADSGILNIIAHGGPLQTVPQNEEVQNQANLAAAQAKEAQARIPGIEEQAKQEAQKTEMNRIAMRDNQILQGVMMTAGGDYDQVIKLLPKSGASPSAVFGALKSVNDAKKQVLENKKETNVLHDQMYDKIRGALGSAFESQDPAVKQAAWEQAISHAGELPPEAQHLATPQYPGDQQAKLLDNLLAGQSKITKEALERQQAAEAGAKGKEAEASAREKDLKTQVEQHQLELYDTLKASPQALSDRIAKSINPQKYPDEYARALNEAQNAPDLKGINKAIEDHSRLVSEREKTIATETDPSVLKSRIDQQVKAETALTPLRTAAAIQLEKAKAALAPGAVAGITDPVLQRNVINKWEAAQTEYATKEGESARLLSYVDAAKKGNQSAGALAPIAEIRSIVNRVNSQELGAAGGAVSAARKIENWISKGVTGTPPADILRDMEEIGKLNLDSAKTTWRGKVRTVNALGAKFPTDEPISGLPEGAPKAVTTGALPRTLTASDVGKTYTNKDGKNVTITAVNPDDPTQFKFK